MFHHSPPSSAPVSYGDAMMQNAPTSFSAALAVTVPAQIPRNGGYFDGNGGSFSSPPSCYSSSVPSSYYNNIQRSISSHSLPMNIQLASGNGNGFFSPSSPSPHQLPLPPPLSSSPSSSSGDLFDFISSCPVRRVFSTGDLQGMNGSSPPRQVAADDGQDGGGPFSQKVGRYSAEERKERIERYRVKRNHRNFNKKITYACRKTLADSRPRVKGRFARNGEADAEADEREACDISYDYCCGGNSELSNGQTSNCYEAGNYYKPGAGGVGGNGAITSSTFNCGSDNGEWWWRAPGAVAAADEAQRQRQAGFDDDDELWATLGDMISVNLAS